MKRPDLLFLLPKFYIHIEIDENGHEQYPCLEEDARLELIAADIGVPGLILRINPDIAPPMLKRCKMASGEAAWKGSPAFLSRMDVIQNFLESTLLRDDAVDGLEVYRWGSLDGIDLVLQK